MRGLQTDRANVVVTVLAILARGALFGVIGWAVDRHLGILDGTAVWAAFVFLIGALSERRREAQ